MNWIAENKNRDKIEFIHSLIRNIANTTNYNDKTEVRCNSRIVKDLLKQREKLYEEGR